MPVVLLSATSPVGELVDALNQARPGILRGYPTMLAVLAAEARAGRLRIRPRIIRSHSEPLLPETRRALEETFGAPVSNTYATTEGAAATACGKGRGMHLNEDCCLIELVDELGQPIRAGERGVRVYVTNLMNLAQPLIRYELPDEMTWIDEPCPCGSPFRRVEDIVGRTTDLFVYADRVTVHPLAFRSVLGHEANVFSYQVRQTTRGATVRIQATGTVDTDALAERISQALSRAGVDDPMVTVTDRETFARLPSGKTPRFVPLEPPR